MWLRALIAANETRYGSSLLLRGQRSASGRLTADEEPRTKEAVCQRDENKPLQRLTPHPHKQQHMTHPQAAYSSRRDPSHLDGGGSGPALLLLFRPSSSCSSHVGHLLLFTDLSGAKRSTKSLRKVLQTQTPALPTHPTFPVTLAPPKPSPLAAAITAPERESLPLPSMMMKLSARNTGSLYRLRLIGRIQGVRRVCVEGGDGEGVEVWCRGLCDGNSTRDVNWLCHSNQAAG